MKIAKAEKRRLHIQRLMMGVISFLLEEILMLILQLLLERDFLKRLNVNIVLNTDKTRIRCCGWKAGTRHANLKDVVLQFRFTDSLFKKRRNGWAFAKKQFNDRLMINKTLGYGMGANVFGFLMFCMLVSPPWVKKIAYKVFR